MKRLLTFGLAAVLPACGLHVAPAYDEPYPDYGYSGGGGGAGGYDYEYASPLNARILTVDGHLRIWTSRPAYVAVFEIVPGQGVGLLYPAYRSEQNYVSGTTSLWISRSRTYYSYFQSASYGEGRDVPRYLYMVASERPLRLTRYVSSPMALRGSLGMSRFMALNPYSTMDELDRLVVPDLEGGSWASDVYVVWPQPRYRDDLRDFDWIRVQCPDGQIIEGPTYYVLGACRTQRDNPPTQQRPPSEPEPRDSVKVPGRKRPEPAGPPGVSTEEEKVRATPGPAIVERIPQVERIRAPVEGSAEPGERTRPGTRPEAPRVERVPEPVEERRPESPRVERVPQPEVERRPEPRVERRPEPSVERVPEPQVERRPEPVVERRPEPQVEHRPEPVRSEPPPRVEYSPPPRVEPPPARVESPAPRSEAPATRPEPPPAER